MAIFHSYVSLPGHRRVIITYVWVVAPRPLSPPWAAVNSGSWSQPLAGDGGETVVRRWLVVFWGISWENHGKIIGISMGKSLEVFFWMELHAFFLEHHWSCLMGIHGDFKGKFHGSWVGFSMGKLSNEIRRMFRPWITRGYKNSHFVIS